CWWGLPAGRVSCSGAATRCCRRPCCVASAVRPSRCWLRKASSPHCRGGRCGWIPAMSIWTAGWPGGGRCWPGLMTACCIAWPPPEGDDSETVFQLGKQAVVGLAVCKGRHVAMLIADQAGLQVQAVHPFVGRLKTNQCAVLGTLAERDAQCSQFQALTQQAAGDTQGGFHTVLPFMEGLHRGIELTDTAVGDFHGHGGVTDTEILSADEYVHAGAFRAAGGKRQGQRPQARQDGADRRGGGVVDAVNPGGFPFVQPAAPGQVAAGAEQGNAAVFEG